MRQITVLGLLLQGWILDIGLTANYARRLCTGEPALQPLSFHSCPNESVTFTCSDSKVSLMKWEVEPHTMADLAYAASLLMADTELLTMNSTDNVLHSTVVFDRIEENFANMTSTLTVATSGVRNGTNVTCTTFVSNDECNVTATIYVTDVPKSIKAEGVVNQEKETHSTAILELGDMFDGGGVPIDHYIIQVDNGTQFETPGPTYSIMYNTTLSVNISAHNCAGYSDPLPLEIQYDEDTEGNMTGMKRPNGGLSMLELAGLIGIGVFLLIVTTLLTVLSLYLIRKKRSKRKISISTNIRMVNSHGGNTRIGLHSNNGTPAQTPAPVEYSYIPVTATRKYLERDCTGQYSTVINTGLNSPDNFIGTYAEIELVTTSSALPPPPVTGETVQYSRPSEKQPCHQTPQEPVQGEVGSNNESSHGQEDQEQNNAEPTDLHPLDKDISVHLILLQLRTVQSCWLALGEAAGLERETMDMINVELGDDSAKLAEVVFRWYERKECVRWSDVSSLCEKIGFNQLSEAIGTAYITGALPVKDDPEVELPFSDKTPAPALPPRRATSGDNEGAPPITPHRPLICDGAPAVPPHSHRHGVAYNEEAAAISLERTEIDGDEGTPPPPPLPPPLAPEDIDF